MHGGIIRDNTAPVGGGVSSNANFTMHAGTIGHTDPALSNTATYYGGGVWTAGTFTLTGTNPKTITNNEARYGGGVWVAEAALLTMATDATNVSITNNHAAYDGGGVFTENYEYKMLLTLSAGGTAVYYQNITLRDDTVFSGNTAGNGPHGPPTNANATTLPNILFASTSGGIAHPINNLDINFRLDVIPFVFHKATQDIYSATGLVNIEDIEPYLLEGAYFALFRFVGTGTAPDFAPIPSDQWVLAYEDERSSGDLGDPIEMFLTPGGIYHLVETAAPAGYRIPLGQWRIVFDDSVPGDFLITAKGEVPAFAYLDGYFYVGNWQQLVLPLMGGMSSNIFFIFGTAVLLAAMGMLLAYQLKRRKFAFAEGGPSVRTCANCRHGKQLTAENIACLKKGVVTPDYVCGRFSGHNQE
jgi:hypothetical protein